MKKLFSLLAFIMLTLGITANAYNCPTDVYFYVSQATSSTVFAKDHTVFTYTVDATEADVYGVIVNTPATSWDDAQSHNAYFPAGKSGDITVDASAEWPAMVEWTGSANNRWSNGCFKFAKGHKYDIKMVHSAEAFNGTVTVQGQEGPVNPPATTGFEAGKEYYLDFSAISWYFDGAAETYVWDGSSNVKAETVSGSVLKFTPGATGTEGMMYVKRINPKNTEEVWNECSIAAPADNDANLFVFNSTFKGGEWKTYSTPQAWLISKNINAWSADAVSEYVFTYTDGIYTVSVPADKLRAEGDDDGFKIGYGALNDWENYYGAMIAGKVLGNGVATDAVKNAQNFLIPAAATTPVTITFNPATAKVTAAWDNTPVGPVDPVGPVESDDRLVISLPKIDVDGEITVDVTLHSAPGKEYVSGQWNIRLPEGFEASDVTLNTERCKDHTIMTNVDEGVLKCMLYSNKNTEIVRVDRPLFSFTLKSASVPVGTYTGSIENIIFNIAPTPENVYNIASKFADTPLEIEVVKAVRTITAEPANIALANGASAQIAVTVEPADATDKTVSWEIVSGEKIISLADDGTVTALASGVATIRVTANDGFGASTEISVTVDGKPVESITLSAAEHTMYIDEEFTLVATVTPDDATNKAISWISSDDNIATVDETGKVRGVSAGEAVIYAIARDGSDVQASCAVSVKARISGDADGDDVLTIADIVIIAKKSVGIDSENMRLENMDIDGDGKITATDVTMAVYFLNLAESTDSPRAQAAPASLGVDTPVVMADASCNVPLSFPEALKAAGIQFDVVTPEGVEITDASYVAPAASNGHAISVARIAENTFRVIIYSAHNFTAQTLGYLNLTDKAGFTRDFDIELKNVMYSDGNTLMETPDRSVSVGAGTARIDDILTGDDNAVYDVYTVGGVCIATGADKAALRNLPAGIYIIGDKKVAID